MTSDRELQRNVQDELAWEPAVHANEINVRVDAGVVTLTGNVCSYFEKWNAARAVHRLSGVTGLLDDTRVVPDNPDRYLDADVARAVQNVLEWTTCVPKNAIQARVHEGWVTLSGTVGWQYQKQAAVYGIRNLRGVNGVSNNIAIDAGLSVNVIQAHIEAALKRCALIDFDRIAVELTGADVTLRGSVRSWAERIAATDAAWAAPGVASVVDCMQLTG